MFGIPKEKNKFASENQAAESIPLLSNQEDPAEAQGVLEGRDVHKVQIHETPSEANRKGASKNECGALIATCLLAALVWGYFAYKICTSYESQGEMPFPP